jgi:hypothetical protein
VSLVESLTYDTLYIDSVFCPWRRFFVNSRLMGSLTKNEVILCIGCTSPSRGNIASADSSELMSPSVLVFSLASYVNFKQRNSTGMAPYSAQRYRSCGHRSSPTRPLPVQALPPERWSLILHAYRGGCIVVRSTTLVWTVRVRCVALFFLFLFILTRLYGIDDIRRNTAEIEELHSGTQRQTKSGYLWSPISCTYVWCFHVGM